MTNDAHTRKAALDPAKSFLVQAPAGSGKTELLVQRFLRLLSCVQAPEEVVALTFTRKAAAEMRARISAALNNAREQVDATSAHREQTLALAQAALARDQDNGWGLCEHPSRLRVLTLDSLCASITRQMPMLSAFGAQPGVAEDARELYLQAAQNTLAELEAGQAWSDAIERLLSHLNNDLGRVAQLLADMLQSRDQWLRFIATRRDTRRQRENLEDALSVQVESVLAQASKHFPGEEVSELISLADFAAANLSATNQASTIRQLQNLPALPQANVTSLPIWQGISDLLLTQGGDWRKAVTIKQGFPAKGAGNTAAEKASFAEMKARLTGLIERLSANNALRHNLALIPQLPTGCYTEAQWQILQALFELLQLAAANLQLVFRDRATVDFIEIAARAGQALGDSDKPTDLALALDYQIKHLLVDEFQDTSLSQFSLLEELVAGWQSDDGRSLFLVGDPMQSIYRFRQAEVGLFLRVRDQGLADIKLGFCQLTANFRSQPAVIDWINQTFPAVMPPRAAEDSAAGAITYTPADAQRSAKNGGVELHAFLGNDHEIEASHLAALVAETRKQQAQASIAILVRSRRHVAHLLPHLQAQGLRFQAVEIQALGQRPVVQDLMALTRCLLHPADRLSALAVLRAPWCGLCLEDLLLVAGNARQKTSHAKAETVMQRLANAEVRNQLSDHGRQASERVNTALQDSLADRGRISLRRWVEGAWLALGGPAAVATPDALEDAQVFLNLLDTTDEGGDLSDLGDFGRLAKQVEDLYAPPDAQADERLQIMTIHRAKGLEFDAVLVPGLGRPPASQTQPLLFWLELPHDESAYTQNHQRDTSDLLLAPIAASGERDEPIYKYLKGMDKVKAEYEQGRLLYVAATRARDTLHLLGHVPETQAGPGKPAAGSLLERLWPGVNTVFTEKLDTLQASQEAQQPNDADDTTMPQLLLRRLPADWRLPELPKGVVLEGGEQESQPAETAEMKSVEYCWAGPDVRHIGTVVHQILMHIAGADPSAWDHVRLDDMHTLIRTRLIALGISPVRVAEPVARVTQALKNMLADERGRWLLQPQLQARCEYAITGMFEGELVNVIIDRTFVDEQNQRWIIDYKTGRHEGGDTELFLDQEQARYAPQLQRYAALMAQTEERPIRLGLYFPMLGGWREWSAE